MKKTILYVSLLVALTPFGCSKKDDPAPAKSKTDLLTSKSWKLQSATLDGIEAKQELFEDCMIDDTYKFNSNGTGIQTDAGMKCEDAPEASTWMFANKESDFIWDGETFKIEELTSSKFIISGSDGIQKAQLTLVAQ